VGLNLLYRPLVISPFFSNPLSLRLSLFSWVAGGSPSASHKCLSPASPPSSRHSRISSSSRSHSPCPLVESPHPSVPLAPSVLSSVPLSDCSLAPSLVSGEPTSSWAGVSARSVRLTTHLSRPSECSSRCLDRQLVSLSSFSICLRLVSL